MGTFAGLLQAAGYEVRGSDTKLYPPMSDKLAAWGIPVMEGYRPENLDPAPDLVIIGNVIRRENPEAQAVIERGLRYASFPAALSELFLSERHPIVVSGTHGKTTTTSLLAWLLIYANRDPGLLVGGVPENLGEGFRVGEGPYFVVEGDEYDTAFFDKQPKFLHYQPKSLILSSLEFDHADIYDNVEAIEAEFRKLVALVPPDGHIVACAGAPRVLALLGETRAQVDTYTADENTRAIWQAREITFSPEGSDFSLFRQHVRVGRFHLPLPGKHNVENAVAAMVIAMRFGLSVTELQAGLLSFKGVSRRQTVIATPGGVRIIDDFAHHPTAVRATVEAVRACYPEGRLFAIFEPRSATSSRRYFQEDYPAAFDAADHVVIAAVGRKELPESERLDAAKLAEAICARGGSGAYVPEVDGIVDWLRHRVEAKDSLLFMSNGGFGGIHKKMAAALERGG